MEATPGNSVVGARRSLHVRHCEEPRLPDPSVDPEVKPPVAPVGRYAGP
jgi:hypothetical protein